MSTPVGISTRPIEQGLIGRSEKLSFGKDDQDSRSDSDQQRLISIRCLRNKLLVGPLRLVEIQDLVGAMAPMASKSKARQQS